MINEVFDQHRNVFSSFPHMSYINRENVERDTHKLWPAHSPRSSSCGNFAAKGKRVSRQAGAHESIDKPKLIALEDLTKPLRQPEKA
jgi:hypothetical protein